ncbi:hypothetical protein [Microbacterium gorillae]|uniref:hypothetical protein n=1 Tax=Microbacterium gorillae TaxID=1231063 RepID=UPI000A7132B9|nr:hypothetical protein [Microbacterium gorillae]
MKLVVRVTGSGDLDPRLVDPKGVERQLAWGPVPHTESTYGRPGDEWGLGLPLNQPGCWALALHRGDSLVATLWFTVS